jgi:hypothetical protein
MLFTQFLKVRLYRSKIREDWTQYTQRILIVHGDGVEKLFDCVSALRDRGNRVLQLRGLGSLVFQILEFRAPT